MMSGEEKATADPTPRDALALLIGGFQGTQLVYVAAKLGLADYLNDGPRRSQDLAQAVQVDPGALHRVMRTLAVFGVLVEHEDGRFGLTPIGELLRTGVPGSLRDQAIANGGPEEWATLGSLLHAVQTGETAFDHANGMSFYQYLTRDPQASENFNRRMITRTAEEARWLLDAYAFSSIDTLVDVGGGHGGLLGAILNRYPATRGILFDLPHVVEGAGPTLANARVHGSCTTVAGDFFEAVPNGGDAYFLSRVIHNWDDVQAVRILRNCRRVLPTTGKLLVWEVVLPQRAVVQPAQTLLRSPVFVDLVMMIFAGGRERTEAEYRALFAEAGLRLTAVIPTASPAGHCVIEGVPT
jgi:hypothetical protein